MFYMGKNLSTNLQNKEIPTVSKKIEINLSDHVSKWKKKYNPNQTENDPINPPNSALMKRMMSTQF